MFDKYGGCMTEILHTPGNLQQTKDEYTIVFLDSPLAELQIIHTEAENPLK